MFAGCLVATIAILAVVVGPKGPGAPADPTALTANPQPDWFLRWYYALIYVKPRGMEEIVMVYAPLLLPIVLIALPLVAWRGERSPARRPWAIVIVAIAVIGFVTLLVLGYRAPWVPAVHSEPLTPAMIGAASGPAYEGAEVFHARGCQSCHTVLGRGGKYGPDLTDVAKRMGREEITVRTLIGIGDMPAYRDILSAEETSALIAFLRALGGRGSRAQTP